MNFVYIFVIIVVIHGTESFIEDSTRIKISEQQRTLLRKLQDFQDPKDDAKPLTWNEILADVLVNKMKIFSFNKRDENDAAKEYTAPSESKSFLTNCFSQILLLYKNCYDRWIKRYEEPEFFDSETTVKPDRVPKSDHSSNEDDPKDDIEIIEPKYHGKLKEAGEGVEKDGCPEDSVKDDKGNCIKVTSRLLVSVPSQCPAGYRADRLGNCRAIFF